MTNPPRPTEPTDPPDPARALVLEAFRALNATDAAAMRGLVTADATFAFPRYAPKQVYGGPDGIESFVGWLAEQFPILTIGVQAVTVAPGRRGPVATVEWTDAGRTKDGADFENSGATVFELVDVPGAGLRIARMRTYLDTVELAGALGLVARIAA